MHNPVTRFRNSVKFLRKIADSRAFSGNPPSLRRAVANPIPFRGDPSTATGLQTFALHATLRVLRDLK